MIRYVLFDLDGTLLPMDQDVFTKAYLKVLAERMQQNGLDPKILIKAIWNGMGQMLRNDGEHTNQEVFWDSMQNDLGKQILSSHSDFDDFYRQDFQKLQQVCGMNPMAAEAVRRVKEKGAVPVVATLPVFPVEAIESRIRWAGIDPKEFALITSYENSSFSKPNPAYYQKILHRLGCQGEECLMVGNNTDEDMIAENTEMKVFLLTDCLINESGKDINRYPHGGFEELLDYLRQL